MPKQTLIETNNFFNQKNNCPVIVQTIYNLNDLEFQLFCTLQFLKESEVNVLMKEVSRVDRTLINRALNNLVDKALCFREKL